MVTGSNQEVRVVTERMIITHGQGFLFCTLVATATMLGWCLWTFGAVFLCFGTSWSFTNGGECFVARCLCLCDVRPPSSSSPTWRLSCPRLNPPCLCHLQSQSPVVKMSFVGVGGRVRSWSVISRRLLSPVPLPAYPAPILVVIPDSVSFYWFRKISSMNQTSHGQTFAFIALAPTLLWSSYEDTTC